MSLLPSGLAGSGSQEERASLTWTGGHTTGKGERERNFTTGHTCQSPYIGYIVCSFLKAKGMLELIVVDCEGMIKHTNKSFLASLQCFACHSFV